MQIINAIKYLIYDEKGQGMTEYGLIIVLVAIALMVSLATFKDKLLALLSRIILALPIV
ncbi:Flp family type IVb pilin [Candidatus Formimonas warabiya]|uniref:Flp family type IVb pilin n=1 Tax=Formimonas warabiya TaxID=1761012 RepID=UPI001F2FBBC8|nr:Flp family type IVb pilin [Candidatus Formimonas warabiya]